MMKLFFLTLLTLYEAKFSDLRVDFRTAVNISAGNVSTGNVTQEQPSDPPPVTEEQPPIISIDVDTPNEIPVEEVLPEEGDTLNVEQSPALRPDTLDPDFVKVLQEREQQLDEQFTRKKAIRDDYWRSIAYGTTYGIQNLNYLEERSRMHMQDTSQRFWDAGYALKAAFKHSPQNLTLVLEYLKDLEATEWARDEKEHAAAKHIEILQEHAAIKDESLFDKFSGMRHSFIISNEAVYEQLCLELDGTISTVGENPMKAQCDLCINEQKCSDVDLFGCPATFVKYEVEDYGSVCLSPEQPPADFASARANCWAKGGDISYTPVPEAAFLVDNIETSWIGFYSPRTATSWHSVYDEGIIEDIDLTTTSGVFECAGLYKDASTESGFNVNAHECLVELLPYFCEV
jgi:hypothetical protein